MKKSIVAIVSFVALGLLFAPQAMAGKVKIYVKNCIQTKKDITAYAFNGKDSVKWFSKTSKTISYGKTKRLTCKGQGKGRCKLGILVKNGTARSYKGKLNRNKYAKVYIQGGNPSKLKIIVSSSDPSCD